MEQGEECCKVCRYWKAYHGDMYPTFGLCHRHAPVLGQDAWPTTHEVNWCGDFSRVSLAGGEVSMTSG